MGTDPKDKQKAIDEKRKADQKKRDARRTAYMKRPKR